MITAPTTVRPDSALAAEVTAIDTQARNPLLLLIGSAVPVAIVTNTFRITGTGVLAYFFGEGVAQGYFHGFSGWGIFFVASVLLCAEVFALTKLADDAEQEEAL